MPEPCARAVRSTSDDGLGHPLSAAPWLSLLFCINISSLPAIHAENPRKPTPQPLAEAVRLDNIALGDWMLRCMNCMGRGKSEMQINTLQMSAIQALVLGP